MQDLTLMPLMPLTHAFDVTLMPLMESLTLGHGLQMGDALIAATALEHKLAVLTGNTKHFEPVEGISVETFRM